MSFLLKNIKEITQNAKVNLYAVYYGYRSKKDNKCVALPEDVNQMMREGLCKSIFKYQDYTASAYDPFVTQKDSYYLVPSKDVEDTYQDIMALMRNAEEYKYGMNNHVINSANLLVCELFYRNKKFLLFSRIGNTTEKILRNKVIILYYPDALEECKKDDLFIVSTDVDCALEVPSDTGTENEVDSNILVFNKNNFDKAFNYSEVQKEIVAKKIQLVEKWDFLDSNKIILDKKEQKNVYQHLAKVFADEGYLKQIETIEPGILKSRIITMCKGKYKFSENDFRDNKLIVTETNLKDVMQMLSKHFKFNFFSGSAEL